VESWMSNKPITKLRVFVASPGDVKRERAIAKKICDEINDGIASLKSLHLELVRWETHARPGKASDAQEVINKQILNSFDIFIGILWKRFGTPTKRAPSGTAEEIDKALAFHEKDPDFPILIYFNTKPYTLTSPKDAEQVSQVLTYKQKLGNSGIFYWSYDGEANFEDLLRRHLTALIKDWKEKIIEEISTIEERSAKPITKTELEGLDPKELIKTGRAYRELGDHNKAIQYFKAANVLDSESVSALFNLAYELDDIDKKEKAIETYKLALKLKPEHDPSWYNMGILLSDLNRDEEAEVAYRTAIKHKPDKHEAWYNLGILLRKLNRDEEAEEAYRTVIKHKPDDHDSWYSLGYLLSDLNRDEEAEEAYRTAIKHKPDDHDSWYGLGKLLEKLNRDEEAKKAHQMADKYKSEAL